VTRKPQGGTFHPVADEIIGPELGLIKGSFLKFVAELDTP